MIRILHVVGIMSRAGTETWLMNVLRNIDRNSFHFDFLVHSNDVGDYEAEIVSLGSKVIRINPFQNLGNYLFSVRGLLSGPQKYDVVHSHVHHFSGIVLMVARTAGVKIRVAHSHSDTLLQNRKSNFLRRAYFSFMEKLIKTNATCGLAASRLAAPSLFGESWFKNPRWKVLYCGIDLNKFSKKVNSKAIRKTLEIHEEDYVIGHVGRFVEVKNHDFLIEVFSRVEKVIPSARLLLIGNGPDIHRIRAAVFALGLMHRVNFAGTRDDVAEILLGAMDVFVFPSKNEGLGLSLVEAQAASLPCITSDMLTEEVAISKVSKLSLKDPAEKWAEEILRVFNNPPKASIEEQNLLKKRFSIESSISSLVSIYTDNHASG